MDANSQGTFLDVAQGALRYATVRHTVPCRELPLDAVPSTGMKNS